MKEVFISILERLKSLKVFRRIAIFNNHVDRLRAGTYYYDTPACFVEIKQKNVRPLQNGISSWDMIIRFHIVHTELDAGDGSMDQNLHVFAYRNLIRKNFVQFFAPQTSSFMADGDEQQFNHTNVYHYIQNFKCHFIDKSALIEYNTIGGYIYWDINELIWEDVLLLWDRAFYGTAYLDDNLLTSNNSVDGNSNEYGTPMTNIYGNDLVSVYKDLIKKVSNINNSNGKPLFKNVFVFNDQIKRMVDSYNVYNTPCCYIQITEDNEYALGQKLSAMDLNITFHICALQLDAGDGTMEQNVKIFDYRDRLNKEMVLHFSPQCSALQYNKEELDYGHGNIYHYKMEYKTHYIDQTAYVPLGTASIDTIGLTVSIVENIKILD